MKTMLLFTATMFFSTLAMAQTGSPSHEDTEQRIDRVFQEREQQERQIAYELAPVKSAADLQKFLAKGTDRTPLAALSPGARQRFLQSLVFTEKGLASFKYDDLRTELTATQIYQVLSLFGAQRSTGTIPGLRVQSRADTLIAQPSGSETDYEGYRCEVKASCHENMHWICVGANC